MELYRSLISNFYKNCSFAFLVYSIDNKQSFEMLDGWLKDIKLNASPELKIALVGNKCDLDNEREVSYEEGERYAINNGFISFIESSAKDNINAKQMFDNTCEMLVNEFVDFSKNNKRNSLNVKLLDFSREYPDRPEKNKNGKCC